MSNIHLYTAQTPNGIKISILLEELGLPYNVTDIEFSKNTQKEPWFLEINPNGRIPALTDTFTDGKPISLFESGSIMQYLTDRYDTEHKVSQLNHFNRYAPEKIEYGINRYRNEVRRLYRTMEIQLQSSTSGYLVGNRCTVADIACWGWLASARYSGVDMAEFPLLDEWVHRMLKRPGVEKGRHVPSKHAYEEIQVLTSKEMDKQAEKGKSWVQAGMKDDSK
ncbi:glutathione S-transferase [Hypoxylon sp. NC1633]|nr:glutathione S-transferase [Hypoxylon sp. NC1633]